MVTTALAKRGYPDLHDHIDALKKAGLLIVVDRLISESIPLLFPLRGSVPVLQCGWARWLCVQFALCQLEAPPPKISAQRGAGLRVN